MDIDMQIENILVPVDFSESADFALEYGIALATRLEARIELLYIAEVSAYSNDSGMDDDEDYESHEERLWRELRQMISCKNTGIPIEANLLTGVPHVEIVERAKSLPSDLIVMGTHGRTETKHLLIGSVAERVVRTAPCPVLTVRHPNYEL